MPRVTVEGSGSFEVETGKRLLVALIENGVDILHRCGGNAKCTTCRVSFISGEPDLRTEAELQRLTEKQEDQGLRLSCQIACEADMELRALLRFTESGLSDPGPEPETTIQPEPVWIKRA